MPTAKKTAISYQGLSNELNDIMSELQRDDLDVDTALKHYERGLNIATQLEEYLKNAENTVKQLKAKFSGE
jgi:exodeoxyribonuclease VII small subunit